MGYHDSKSKLPVYFKAMLMYVCRQMDSPGKPFVYIHYHIFLNSLVVHRLVKVIWLCKVKPMCFSQSCVSFTR